MTRRRDEQPVDHLPRGRLLRRLRPHRLRGVHPRARVDRLQPDVGARRRGVPDALRARCLHGPRSAGRRRGDLVLGPDHGLAPARAPLPRLPRMAQPADTTAATDLAALEALADSVESGAGLPDVVRAAARALDASLVVLDRAGHVLAVAARSPNEEQAILAGGSGIEIVALRLGGEPIGELRVRLRGE